MKSLDLISLAGVPQTGATCRSTYACIAVMRASRSMPRGVAALLKQAMVGITPWLNAPNTALVCFILVSFRCWFFAVKNASDYSMRCIDIQSFIIVQNLLEATKRSNRRETAERNSFVCYLQDVLSR